MKQKVILHNGKNIMVVLIYLMLLWLNIYHIFCRGQWARCGRTYLSLVDVFKHLPHLLQETMSKMFLRHLLQETMSKMFLIQLTGYVYSLRKT